MEIVEHKCVCKKKKGLIHSECFISQSMDSVVAGFLLVFGRTNVSTSSSTPAGEVLILAIV